MSSIRDEISKIIDVRIPPNGYRKYIKSISRSGAFQQLQHEDSLIALFEAVDALQSKVAELSEKSSTVVTERGPIDNSYPTTTVSSAVTPTVIEHLTKAASTAWFTCSDCGQSFRPKIALLGHQRKHKKNAPTH